LHDLVRLCGGLPLALQAVGSELITRGGLPVEREFAEPPVRNARREAPAPHEQSPGTGRVGAQRVAARPWGDPR
ncbi:hypothetical protein ACWDRR_30985, partial [Kitasatospora sp. NPDC003701]